ncbi:MAG: glutamate--tRNA ligase [Deltaproteobacteria bacterium]|nr:glutamate--tRNA ligase [Deltaproteobacteria bacterium]
MSTPRLRFAPSPSGFLHIGGARTALFCWLFARKNGGSFILRVEDTDAARSTDESIQAILDGLHWLGLDWDEGPGVDGPHAPYFQSQRKAVYQEHIDRLIDSGHLYRCFCTAEELKEKRELAQKEGRKPAYDRKCRDLSPDEWPADTPYVLRLKAPLDGATVVQDLIRGEVVFQNKELSDQVVVRSNGDPLYNFVVVVDDATMEVTHVVRGDDHLNNTPKQIQLYEALGFEPPVFAHAPLILGPDKKRLSKRHGATNVMQYDDEGYLAPALVNFLARLGWSHGDQEIFTIDELVEYFSLDGVGKSPGVWNPEKLLWLNGQYITAMTSQQLAEAIAPRVEAAGHPAQPPDALMARRIETLKERAKTLNDLVDQGHFYWAAADGIAYDDAKAKRKFLNGDTLPRLEAALAALQGVDDWTESALEPPLKQVLEQLDLKMGKLAQPIRVALTGSTVSPGLFETLAALGRDKCLHRLRTGIALAREAAAQADSSPAESQAPLL